MSHTDQPNGLERDELRNRIQSIEKRISKIEQYLRDLHFSKDNLITDQVPLPNKSKSHSTSELGEDDIEFRIGEFGLAWLGSIVLLLGIIFLMNYTKNSGYPIGTSFIGYISSALVFAGAHLLRKNFSNLVFMLRISGHLLLYYVTLLLYFFTPEPLISNSWIVISLLLIISGWQVFLAIRKKSEFHGGLAIVLCLSTAIISDSIHIQLPLLFISSVISLYFFYRFSWWHIFLLSLFLVYFSHLLFLLGNPIMGHPLRQLPHHEFNHIYLVGYFGVYSIIASLRQKLSISNNLLVLLLVWNGICFSSILGINIVFFFKNNFIGIFGLISFLSIIYSVILNSLKSKQFETAFYACFGFMALSVSVYGYSHLPNTFLWLALQSMLVVSLALWFQSRLITIVNTLLYLGILLGYLLYAKPEGIISFSFALVAFGSARILNWKKDRLSLRTDLMRNMYLAAILIMMLYGLYHSVPKEYITLSWTATAGLFFLMSILLHNFKYRWLAICTLFITVTYLFWVDMADMEVGYRIIAFFFLAVISLGVSLYYTKKIRKK